MFQLKKCASLVVLVFVLMGALTAMAAPQSFTGTLSESMCGAKHMMAGKTDAECTRACIKANSKYALVADKKIYILSGREEDFSTLAGKRVRVTGENSGDTISVQSIHVVSN